MVGTSTEAIAKLLRDAAYDPTEWPKALAAVDAFLDSSGVALLCVDERLKCAPCTENIHEMMEDYFNGGWHGRDLRETCVPVMKERGFAIDYQFQDMESIESTEYYQGFLRRHRQKWFVGVGASIGDDLWCLAIQRSKDKGAFQQSEVKKLEAVQVLLSESANAASGISRSWISGALSALQGVGEAAFILDWRGRLVHINQSGQSLIGKFIDHAGRMHLPDFEANRIITHLVDRARSWRAKVYPIKTSRPFLIGQQLFDLEATVLSDEPALLLSSALILGQLRPHKTVLNQVLKQSYGLTLAEIRVATLLYKGKELKEISSALKVSENTVRSHLKSIFYKTSTNSQARFVSLMLSLYRQ